MFDSFKNLVFIKAEQQTSDGSFLEENKKAHYSGKIIFKTIKDINLSVDMLLFLFFLVAALALLYEPNDLEKRFSSQWTLLDLSTCR